MKLAQALDTALDRSVVGSYPRWGLAIRRRLPHWPADAPPGALKNKTALVTGATSGLGTATAQALARLGATVHLVVRDTVKGQRVADDIPGAKVWRCDVSDLDDVARFAGELDFAVDILVHNAGVLPAERRTSPQGHELTLATHVLGPLRMTELLRPALAGGRIILVSSGGMYAQRLPVDDPEFLRGEYKGAAAYARTKRMQVALVPLLAQRWVADDISVYATHPGWADTPGVASSLPAFHRIMGPFLRDAHQGADTTVWLAGAEPAPASGLFWHDRRSRSPHLVPWTRYDTAAAQELLTWCVDAAKVAS